MTYKIYKAFTAYNIRNTFTVSYENLIINTMNKINEGEKEECKSIIRTVFFIYCAPYIVLGSLLKSKFNIDYPMSDAIILVFFIAMYGFLDIRNFTEIKTKMVQLMKCATFIFTATLFLSIEYNINLQLLTKVYIGALLAFALIILFAYISIISGNFWVIVAKKIVKHSLSKENKINVLVFQLGLFIEIPILLSAILRYIKG